MEWELVWMLVAQMGHGQLRMGQGGVYTRILGTLGESSMGCKNHSGDIAGKYVVMEPGTVVYRFRFERWKCYLNQRMVHC